MKMAQTYPEKWPPISGYGDGGFRIGGERTEGSVLLVEGQVLAWHCRHAGEFDVAALEVMRELAPPPEFLLIGFGADGNPVPSHMLKALENFSIPVELMNTGAACRTYNVLLAEGRDVAAALIAVI